MGEVYRARDTKLQREVALKVLPALVAADPERLSRFRREAQLLASLNHPHIGAIFGVEDTDRVALVLELIDGDTLAERIAQGPLPWKEAVAIAIQIADGLEAAHQRGVIHRDLKPANVKLAESGRAKVIDFGLAKAASSGAFRSGSGEQTAAATMTAFDATREGMVVGTIGYMSPEQARGQTIDKRTDIWAFGCVLFEMLSGRAPFGGGTPTDTLAAIVEREPPWKELPSSVPSAVLDVLRRCLAKDPKRRFHDLADVRIVMEDALAAPAAPMKSASSTWRPTAAALLVGIAGGAAVVWGIVRRTDSAATPTSSVERVARFVIIPESPLSQSDTSCAAGGCGGESVLAISPDGQRMVYAAGTEGQHQLYIRAIDQFEGRPIPGTENGHVPAFSPDGQMLAFIADRKLKKISLAGGVPTIVRESVEGEGLDWADDGYIYFSPGLASSIWRVPAAGGTASAVTVLDKVLEHRYPALLPGGSALLYTAVAGASGTGEQILVQSLRTGEQRVLTPGAAPRYLSTGHLVYVLSGQLMAVRFDPVRLEMQGAPVGVIDGVEQTLAGTPQFAISRSGSLIYVGATGQSTQTALMWVTTGGVESPTHGAGPLYVQPRLSPDDRRVAVALRGNASDVWQFELARETWTRLTFDANSSFPLWTPDGRHLSFASGKGQPGSIHWKPLDGSQSDTPLFSKETGTVPLAWSPDSRTLAFVSVDPQTGQDIWMLNVGDPGHAHPFLQTRFREGAPTFSPDGRWVAYVSDESGRNEIYVRPYPGPGQEWIISQEGGSEPVWARNGQLFYRNGDEMMVVDIRSTPEFFAGRPRRLFQRAYDRSNAYWPNYDVSRDGQRLLMMKTIDQTGAPPRRVNVVVNWLEELKQRVP